MLWMMGMAMGWLMMVSSFTGKKSGSCCHVPFFCHLFQAKCFRFFELLHHAERPQQGAGLVFRLCDLKMGAAPGPQEHVQVKISFQPQPQCLEKTVCKRVETVSSFKDLPS